MSTLLPFDPGDEGPRPRFHPLRQVTYKSTPQGDLDITIQLPFDWQAGDRRPAILFFFGGAWTHGTVMQFSRQATYLAQRGMVAARADYRVQEKHQTNPDACVEDARSAVRWMRLNADALGIDPQRLVAAGGSAGGHIALCAGMTPGLDAEGEDLAISTMPNALVLFNPVVDLRTVRHIEERPLDESLRELISPIAQLSAETPPLWMTYGTEDQFAAPVPEFVERATALGVRAEVYWAEGEKHAFFNGAPWWQRTLHQADVFLASLGYINGPPTFEMP